MFNLQLMPLPLALRNRVYDDGEEEDGANHSIELELASLDILVTPELKEIGPFFSFFRERKNLITSRSLFTRAIARAMVSRN